MRPIDADALNAKFEDAKMCAKLLDTIFLCGAQAVVDAAPTIDPADLVKRGRWNDTYKSGHIPNPRNVCSECDCWNNRRSSYCPVCGAKMMEDTK